MVLELGPQVGHLTLQWSSLPGCEPARRDERDDRYSRNLHDACFGGCWGVQISNATVMIHGSFAEQSNTKSESAMEAFNCQRLRHVVVRKN
jgi:hypothetical protein